MSTEMDFDTVKKTLLQLEYKTIQLDVPNAPTVPIKTWTGVSAQVPGGGFGMFTRVRYFLEDGKVRVTKAGQEDLWYILGD